MTKVRNKEVLISESYGGRRGKTLAVLHTIVEYLSHYGNIAKLSEGNRRGSSTSNLRPTTWSTTKSLKGGRQ